MITILVTGASGFLGRAVVKQLQALPAWGDGKMNILHPPHRLVDLTDRHAVEEFFGTYQPDRVIHLAGQIGGIQSNVERPGEFFYSNMLMGMNVVEACRKFKTDRLVMVGTSCMYPEGASKNQNPISESQLFNGYPARDTAAYGMAKRALLAMCLAYRHQYHLRSTFLIPTNLYGPGDTSNHVVADLTRKFCSGADSVIVWGDGKQTRDFLHVDDCARAIIEAVRKYDTCFIINVASGVETSILELATYIKLFSGNPAPILFDPTKPVGQEARVFDIFRAEFDLGWKPEIPLKEGIKQTVDAFKQANKI